ncbi:hypothetical protein ABTN06_18845, partial [Acinetobacter baumannii]
DGGRGPHHHPRAGGNPPPGGKRRSGASGSGSPQGPLLPLTGCQGLGRGPGGAPPVPKGVLAPPQPGPARLGIPASP